MTVCVGNICRSPVAEGLLKAALPQCEVWSSGLSALVGHPADPMAVQIAKKHSLDISAHRAQQISSWMVSHADLILVMEAYQQRELEKKYPLARGKIRCIGEFGASGAFDVADPYTQGQSAFETSHNAIALGATTWISRIRQLTS